MPQGKKCWGRNQILCVCVCVCVCVYTHRHSLSSTSGKWWCRVFTKIIRSFWIDLFDYMQQSLIATASLPTHNIMVTDKMCDIRLIVKIYMWSGGKPTQRGSWRRETLCMQIKKVYPIHPSGCTEILGTVCHAENSPHNGLHSLLWQEGTMPILKSGQPDTASATD